MLYCFPYIRNLILLFILLFPELFLAQTTVTYTSSGTFVVPYGVTSLTVECYGGGGGGGGDGTDNSVGGSGGGGGAYARSVIAVTPGASYPYTVGAAGTAGANGAAGGAGGNTTFNTTTVVAAGGSGGGANGAAGGAGGTTAASTGDVEYAGGDGATSADVNGRGGGGSGGTSSAGNTGGNQAGATAVTGGYAGGAGGTGDGSQGSAPTAGNYGGGGGGSGDKSGASEDGGAGLAGVIKITYTGAAQTLTVGASGDDFTSITATRTALESKGIAGPITIELQSDYNEAGETYPISFAAVTGASATNTITYRPATGVTALVSDADAGTGASLITLSGADYITFDGRPGGTGTTLADIQWTFRNTRTAASVGPTFEFLSDATYNTLKFLNIEGESAGSNEGIINLGGGPTTGNDYNSFSYCKVQDLTTGGTASFPLGGICVNGTSEAISDGYITVDNCHIFNISTPAAVSTTYIGGYELSNWTITNNHMYHSSATALPTAVTGTFYTFIFIDDGTGHTVTGNYMGGTASSCGGSALTYSGASNIRGIHLQSLTAGTTTISNNYFSNFSITSTMNVSAGNAYLVAFRLYGSSDISLTNNTIGSLTADGNITITHNNASALGGILAIWNGASATTDISSNSIGGITINAGTATGTLNAMIHNYTGSSTALTVTNNTIGGVVGAGAISIADDIFMRGIYTEQTSATTITGNTIQNFSHTGDGSFIGIFGNVGVITCTSNTIKDISLGASNTKKHYLIAHGGNIATNGYDPTAGTLANSPTISSNNISNITVNNTGTATQLTVIYIRASGTITCSSNTIGSTTANNMSMANNASNYGMYFTGNGTITASSNTIQQWNLTNTGTTNSFAGIWNADGTLSACDANTLKNITTAGEATHYMIGVSTTDNASVTNSVIQDITISGTSSTAILRCILVSTSGTITCSSNTIGSTTNNNITIAANSQNEGIRLDGTSTAITCNSNTIQEFNLTNTGATSIFYGIYAVTGVFNATSNTIKNIDIAGVGATSTILYGIHCATASASNTIISNTISDLNATTTSANSPYVRGISVTTGGGTVKKNMVKNLTNAATSSPFIYGINVVSGSWGLHNNVILLSNGGIDNNISLNGINDGSTGTMTIYHNTIKISGTTTAGAVTRGYRRTAAGTTTVKNNIFQNTRTGTGTHYAYSATDVTTITTDDNYLEATDDANAVGYWNATAYSFANWQTAFAGEDNSLSGTETINSTTGKAATTFVGANQGVDLFTGSIVTDDNEGTARDVAPWMGAFEGGVTLPIELTSFTGSKEGKNNELFWVTATELNNDFFTLEKTYDGESFEIVGTLDGAGNSNQYLYYTFIDYDVREVLNYYRLKQTDFDGKFAYSNIITIDNRTNTSNKEIVMITNILGQEVNEFYRGIVVIVYADGTSMKIIQ